jgi:hypothetical protein
VDRTASVVCTRGSSGGSVDQGLGADLDRPDQIQGRTSPTREEAAAGAAVDRHCGLSPRVHGAPVTDREEVRDQGRWFRDLRLRTHTRKRRLCTPACGGARRRLHRKLAGRAQTRASGHVFERGKAQHGAGDTGNSTTGSRRRLWLRVNGTTAGGGRRRRAHGR